MLPSKLIVLMPKVHELTADSKRKLAGRTCNEDVDLGRTNF
jgi:hypothetical protein